MVSNNLAPHGLVVGTSLCVLGFEDVGNALSVIEISCTAFINVLDLENGLVFLLSALSAFEVQKDCLLVESKRIVSKIEEILPNRLSGF